MKILLLIYSLFLSTIGNKPKTDFSKHTVQTDTSRYAILKFYKEYGEYIFDKNCHPTSLSTDEIYSIEKLIKKEVDKHNQDAKSHSVVTNPEKYYKQLVPVINSKGEKEVWIQCYCGLPSNRNWKKLLILVSDGGSCYFHLKINLTKCVVHDFRVNTPI